MANARTPYHRTVLLYQEAMERAVDLSDPTNETLSVHMSECPLCKAPVGQPCRGTLKRYLLGVHAVRKGMARRLAKAEGYTSRAEWVKAHLKVIRDRRIELI